MSVVLHLNAGVTLLLAVTTLLGAATSDKRTLLLLDAWRRVPDLFELARASTKDGDVHREQDRLEKDHHAKRLPFRTTSNFRHQMRCSTQEHTFGAALFRLVNAEGESVTITREALHEIEQHGASFSPAVATFLQQLTETTTIPPNALSLVRFPGSLVVDENVPGAYDQGRPQDPRWAVARDLRFVAPTEATVTRGPRETVTVKATLANPTTQPMTAVLWQVQHLNPLHVELIESASVKKKPPDPSAPPLPPPVPLPPIRVVVPPRTEVVFQSDLDLSAYAITKATPLRVQWSFHYWKAQPEQGTLVVR